MMINKNYSKHFNILLVDDDPLVHETTKFEFGAYPEFQFKYFVSGEEGIEEIKKNSHKYALIILDYQLGEEKLDGAQAAKEILNINSDQLIVTYSGDDSRGALKDTFKAGVVDFLEKTISHDEKLEIILKHCQSFRKRHEALCPNRLENKYEETLKKVGLVGRTEKMFRVGEQIKLAAQHDSNVLVRGETGTGKELVAKAIHYNSNRSLRPFIAVNCGAINTSTMASELFGHKKGSFTGAISDKKGLFEEANGGTVFLDEIGDMPLNIQVAILRVIQEGEIVPLGSNISKKVNIRIIAATHVNLEQKIKDKEFREDLYFRLNILDINIPPLRERRDDLEPLLLHFSKCFSTPKFFTPPVVEKLKSYDWPGNVRQLENAVKKLDIFTGNADRIRAEDVGIDFFTSISIASPTKDTETPTSLNTIDDLKEYTDSIEKRFWESKIKMSRSINELAKAFKIPKTSLYRKLSSLEIQH
jgi:DNA-binding NtrC family response regulator